MSQAHFPLSRGGGIDITDEDGTTKRLRIHHIHMEEDVAKLGYEMEGRVPVSLVDLNRAGQSKAMGFLIGQVMQASGGKANPKIIRELLAKILKKI